MTRFKLKKSISAPRINPKDIAGDFILYRHPDPSVFKRAYATGFIHILFWSTFAYFISRETKTSTLLSPPAREVEESNLRKHRDLIIGVGVAGFGFGLQWLVHRYAGKNVKTITILNGGKSVLLENCQVVFSVGDSLFALRFLV